MYTAPLVQKNLKSPSIKYLKILHNIQKGIPCSTDNSRLYSMIRFCESRISLKITYKTAFHTKYYMKK